VILVVDDERDLAATCERLLRRRGHVVVTVGSRWAALAVLASRPPALLISDVRLPDGNGLDVVRAAAAMRPRVSAIVITGHVSRAGRAAAQDAGAVAYVTKPFTADSFASLVDRVLGERSDAPEGNRR
jgi:DNA-binding NtrC family response regulator